MRMLRPDRQVFLGRDSGWMVSWNLSRGSVSDFYDLIRRCQSGELFSPVTRNQYEAAERNNRAAAPGPMFPASPLSYGYCNIGRCSVPTHHIQDGPKSTTDVETAALILTEGHPIIMKDDAYLVESRSGYRDFVHGCEDLEDISYSVVSEEQ